MLMSVEDRKRYPKLAYYVKNNLPEVIHVPVIVSALNKIGQVNLTRLRIALRWGGLPNLRVADLPPGTLGEFTPDSHSQELRISRAMVEEFESGKGVRVTPKGGRVFLIGVTILHELVHWGDDQDGIDRPGEEGEEFERAVYRGVIS